MVSISKYVVGSAAWLTMSLASKDKGFDPFAKSDGCEVFVSPSDQSLLATCDTYCLYTPK